MQIINVRELRNAIPHLRQTLEREHELVLVSNGETIARILPVQPRPRIESLKWLRDQIGGLQPDSTAMIREERDRH